MTSIASGMKRRCGLGEMFANDARIADLLVTERELVVRQTDRSRFVGELGVLQGAGMERDRAGLLATGMGNSTVQTPQRRKLCIRNALLERVRRPAQGAGRLLQVVLKKPGFGERASNCEFILAI